MYHTLVLLSSLLQSSPGQAANSGAEVGTQVLLTSRDFDDKVICVEGLTRLDKNRSATIGTEDHADEEKVIPWAEGNGLWGAITTLVSDLIGVDIVTFFVRNPYAYDSAENLATRVGRQVAQIEPILENLANAGLLKATDLDSIRVYELTDAPHRRQTLQQYVTWLQEGYHWARMVMDHRQNG